MVSAAPGIRDILRGWAELFNERIERYLVPSNDAPEVLVEAMRYSMLAPGKRLRPFLVDRSYRLAGGQGNTVDYLGVAVECLHVFTLIHDDLPAMDNADLRRGQASNHKVFGEDMAILAGDALLAFGFELAVRHGTDADRTLGIIQELADTIGCTGVIGGQVFDMAGEDKLPDLRLTRYIHQRKTARLFQACCRVGAIAAGANEQILKSLSDYGLHFGLAFQIADDLLDKTGSTETLGKQVGQDVGRQKQTYPDAVGIDESRRLGEQAVLQAIAALKSFGPEADELRELAHYVTDRTN